MVKVVVMGLRNNFKMFVEDAELCTLGWIARRLIHP
jgi:hypothetical protein